MSNAADASADALVSRCQNGDRAALDQMYRLYAARLFRTLSALLGSAHEAEDALQKTFAEAFRSIHRFRGDSSLSTWLHGIAIRVATHQQRGRHRQANLAASYEAGSVSASPADPEEQAWLKEMSVRLHEALGRLTEKKRVAFLLHHGQGLKLPEVAQLMNASVQTTFARVKAARTELMELLAGREP